MASLVSSALKGRLWAGSELSLDREMNWVLGTQLKGEDQVSLQVRQAEGLREGQKYREPHHHLPGEGEPAEGLRPYQWNLGKGRPGFNEVRLWKAKLLQALPHEYSSYERASNRKATQSGLRSVGDSGC